ncbi:class I SAM-dependent methyltransferase [Muricoccus nepalensis]|nr:class I SAM-dependent methyltransferase [Roseomonas nepalensis]
MGRWSRRLAEPFLDFADPGGAGCILDLGCGTGSLAQALAGRSRACRVVGLDASDAYVEHARRRIDDPRVEVRAGDACAIPFPDQSFDGVLSLLMLPFVPRADTAVAEMRRVARPGAIVAAASWDARGGLVAQRIFLDTAAVLDPGGAGLRARNCTRPTTRPGELAAIWRAAGFRDIREAALTIRMEYAGFGDYWGPFVGGQGPAAEYVAALNRTALARLREHVRRAYLDGEPDGPRSYAATAWAVRGIAPGVARGAGSVTRPLERRAPASGASECRSHQPRSGRRSIR